MLGLDTSVTVRLLVGEPERQTEAAQRTLREHGDEGVIISDLVVGESYFVLRHHYRVPNAAAVGALRALLADPRVRADGVARQVLEEMGAASEAPGLMDRLIHGDYQRIGADLLTFDRDAAGLTGAQLLTS